MKFHKPLLTALAAGALLFAGSVIAQDAPVPPPPPPTDNMSPPPPVPPTPPAAPEPPAPPTSADMPAAPPPPADMPTTPPPPPAPADTMATPPPAGDTMAPPASGAPAGQVEVHSSMPEPPPAGPAPSFEQLSGGAKFITEEQAVAYPPLANDFLYADHNRNGKISKSEYEKWVAQK